MKADHGRCAPRNPTGSFFVGHQVVSELNGGVCTCCAHQRAARPSIFLSRAGTMRRSLVIAQTLQSGMDRSRPRQTRKWWAKVDYWPEDFPELAA